MGYTLIIIAIGESLVKAYVAEQWGRRWITIDTSRVALALARTRIMAARFPYYLLADSQEGIKKEPELTDDQPYEDNKRIRVTGPFTVESLSPHRIIAMEDERPAVEVEAQKEAGAGQFETMILDNLKKAGVQNTVKNERLKFDHLDPYAGEWLHAEGEYTEKDGTTRRVAVCIGPEHGTVGPDLVKDADKEAVDITVLSKPGIDIEAHFPDGKVLVAECKGEPTPSAGDWRW